MERTPFELFGALVSSPYCCLLRSRWAVLCGGWKYTVKRAT